MKTLYLLRHAKSAWDDPGLADVARPLAPRGRKAATRVGRALRESGRLPELVLCSPARRAADTLARVLAELGPDPVPVETCEALYFGGPAALLLRVQTLPATLYRVMLVAHDPDLHELAVLLAGSGPTAARVSLSEKFPTGALALLDFPGDDWAAVAPGAGRLREFLRPRDLS